MECRLNMRYPRRVVSTQSLVGFALFTAASTALAELDFDLPSFGEWSEDVILLDAPILDGFGAGCPIEAVDSLSLFTARTDDSGALNLWVNERDAVDAEFLPGEALPEPVNLSESRDFCPTPVPGNGLLFVSDRPGGCGDTVDIHFSTLSPSGWTEPESLGCHPFGPNTPSTEFSPALVVNWRGVFLYYSTAFFSGNQDLYVSRLGPRGFRGGFPVQGTNTDFDDRQPNLSRDGLEVVFASDRHDPGSGNFDIYYAQRSDINRPFSEPINLSQTVPFSSVDESETRPSISRDGRRLVWGAGGIIYESQREEIEQDCFRFVLQPFCPDD